MTPHGLLTMFGLGFAIGAIGALVAMAVYAVLRHAARPFPLFHINSALDALRMAWRRGSTCLCAPGYVCEACRRGAR